jgi:hypothetical protein
VTFGFYTVLINRQKALKHHKGIPVCPEKQDRDKERSI